LLEKGRHFISPKILRTLGLELGLSLELGLRLGLGLAEIYFRSNLFSSKCRIFAKKDISVSVALSRGSDVATGRGVGD